MFDTKEYNRIKKDDQTDEFYIKLGSKKKEGKKWLRILSMIQNIVKKYMNGCLEKLKNNCMFYYIYDMFCMLFYVNVYVEKLIDAYNWKKLYAFFM